MPQQVLFFFEHRGSTSFKSCPTIDKCVVSNVIQYVFSKPRGRRFERRSTIILKFNSNCPCVCGDGMREISFCTQYGIEFKAKQLSLFYFRARQNLSFEMGSTYLSVFNVAITVFLFNFEPDFF